MESVEKWNAMQRITLLRYAERVTMKRTGRSLETSDWSTMELLRNAEFEREMIERGSKFMEDIRSRRTV